MSRGRSWLVAATRRTSTLTGGVAAHRLDLPLLHRPEQLGLDGQGQIPHFIQEEAAAMGQPEFARTGVIGAGKGPPHVPEQLAARPETPSGRRS